eukprot:1157280-Pelagomonas_calceolata.AAC.6
MAHAYNDWKSLDSYCSPIWHVASHACSSTNWWVLCLRYLEWKRSFRDAYTSTGGNACERHTFGIQQDVCLGLVEPQESCHMCIAEGTGILWATENQGAGLDKPEGDITRVASVDWRAAIPCHRLDGH